MIGRPEIRTKVRTGDGTPSRINNGDGLLGSRASLALLDLVERPDVDARCFGEGGKGSRKSDRHDPNLAILAKMSTPINPFPSVGLFVQHEHMNKRHWPQRDFFRSLVDAKIEKGISKEQQAKAMNMAVSSLVTHYSGDREPGKATLRKMVTYYGVELADLTDDPGTHPRFGGVFFCPKKSLTGVLTTWPFWPIFDGVEPRTPR